MMRKRPRREREMPALDIEDLTLDQLIDVVYFGGIATDGEGRVVFRATAEQQAEALQRLVEVA